MDILKVTDYIIVICWYVDYIVYLLQFIEQPFFPLTVKGSISSKAIMHPITQRWVSLFILK